MRHPVAIRLTQKTLRYWVQRYALRKKRHAIEPSFTCYAKSVTGGKRVGEKYVTEAEAIGT